MGFPGMPQRQAANAEGRAVARKRAHMAPPDLIPGMRRSFGQSRRARSGRIHREHLLDFEMHDVVAFARCRREPRRVDLDQASSIGPDRSTRAQIAHQERHGRTSHTEYLRERLLGEREHIMVDAVAKLKQPASHARFDRVKRVAGRTELKLLQHRLDMNLDRVPYRRAPVKSGVKSRCGYPGGGAGRTNDRGIVCRRRPEHRKNTYRPFAPDCGDGNRMPIRHVDHQRDRAAIREEDVLDRVTRPRNNRVLIERDHLKLGPQQIKIRCRQSCKKAITHSSRRRHCGEPAVKSPRPSPFGASRNGGLNMSLNLPSLRILTQKNSEL